MKSESFNIVITGIFVFIVSIYFSTAIHEFGHDIAYFAFGCKSVGIFVSPLVVGYTKCNSPIGFEEALTRGQEILATISGPLFALISGTVFLVIYTHVKTISKYYTLSFILFFFSFFLLLNASLQFLISGDMNVLAKLNFSRLYILPLNLISCGMLLYEILIFKSLLKRVYPKNPHIVKRIYTLFLTFIIIVLIVYFVYR